MSPVFADLEVGQEIGKRSFPVQRDTLVRYAGASGDFNPIHWNERFALDVGLPGVIAHGMFTMGAVVNIVTDWAGNPGAVIDYVVRFTRPVVVPDPGEAEIEAVAKVGKLDPESGTARIDITATADGVKILGKAQATVQF